MTNPSEGFTERTKTDWTPKRPCPEMRRLKSSDLFAGQTEIGIDHGGSLYRLKITRQGKLILNK